MVVAASVGKDRDSAESLWKIDLEKDNNQKNTARKIECFGSHWEFVAVCRPSPSNVIEFKLFWKDKWANVSAFGFAQLVETSLKILVAIIYNLSMWWLIEGVNTYASQMFWKRNYKLCIFFHFTVTCYFVFVFYKSKSYNIHLGL